ncbi:MAG: TonB-dependent receptor [Sphingobacteriaceae bacterium]|nr:TonB-dependent receptor [Sphingobacteriaceae bacterium]
MTPLLLMFFLQGYAQQNSVSGKVIDASGEPVIGASVKVKGTSIGTASDAEGAFRLSVPENSTLQVSSIGFILVETPATPNQPMVIRLVTDIKQLSEVVVVGYGTTKKVSLTGAVSQVGEEVFKDRTVSNPVVAIQGEVPGLIVTRTSSRPGNENLNIRIRGENSINSQNSDPLIVVDGMVIALSEFSSLNPNDIDNISVLKSASASIYGARAANGVILVTTKRGKSGKMQINYNSNIRFNTIGITTPFADMKKWATQYLLAAQQDKINPVTGAVTEWYPQWTKVNLEKMAVGEPFLFTDPANQKVYQFANNNYLNELYDNSTSQAHNLSLRGSGENTAYMLSVGFADNNSVLKTAYDGEKKYNLRLNYDFKPTSKIKLESGISYDNRIISSPKNGIGQGFFDAPVFPTYNSQGQYYDDYSGTRNPVAATKEGGRNNYAEPVFRLNSKLSVDIIEGLTASATAGISRRNGWRTQYNQPYKNYNWLGTNITGNMFAQPEIIETIGRVAYQNYGGFLDYNKTLLSSHNIKVMGGYTTELNRSKDVMARRTNLETPGLIDLNAANPVTQTNSGGASEWALLSWIGRFNYDYKEKYLLQLQGRRDGSSFFHPDYLWSNFGGASVAWRISQENFMSKLGFLNELKVRAEYGETGGQSGLTPYDYIPTINITGTLPFGDTRNLQQTASVAAITEYERTWERMRNYNLGVDFAVLNNRLSGSFDLFQRTNIGMLVPITYPQVLGGTAPRTNDGNFDTKGWEFALNWRSKVKDFRYNVAFNVGDNSNTVSKMPNTNVPGQGKIEAREGYAYNSLFVYETAGYFKDQAEINAYYAKYGNRGNLTSVSPTHVSARLRPGDLIVVDRNGDNTIDNNDTYDYGNASPHLSFGVNLGAQWKGFDLSAFFQGVGRQNLLRSGNTRAPFFRNFYNVNTSYVGKTWTTENINAEYPRMSFDNAKNNWNWQFNDVNVQKLSYIRMKSLILGYTIPQSITSKIKVGKIRAYFSGGDLFEFTTLKDGFDPEFQESADSTYPFLRTYSFGLDVTF